MRRVKSLTILVTYNEQEKRIGISALFDGCGSTQAEEIYNCIY